MVIQQPLQPALVRAIEFTDPDAKHRRGLVTVAVAASIAAHAIVGFYVYEAKYGLTAPVADVGRPNHHHHDRAKVHRREAGQARYASAAARPGAAPRSARARTHDHQTSDAAPARPLAYLDTPPLLAPFVAPTPPEPPQHASVITSPDWLQRPGPSEFSRYYPAGAIDRDLGGSVTLECLVSASGHVRNCAIADETRRAPASAMRPGNWRPTSA